MMPGMSPDELSQYYSELRELTEQYVRSAQLLYDGIEKMKNSWAFDQNPQIISIENELIRTEKELCPQLYSLLDIIRQTGDSHLAAPSPGGF